MKFASWNVNGLRARVGKGEFTNFMRDYSPDFICLQEIKMTPEQKQFDLGNVFEYWNPGGRKGVSGTAVFAGRKAVSAVNDMGIAPEDDGGRVITLEFDEFYLVTAYVPTGSDGSRREAMQKKLRWLAVFIDYVSELNREKPVILGGDMNIAHQAVDLSFPDPKSPGFTPQERAAITRLLDAGFVDSFRCLNPDAADCYSWVSNRFKTGGLRLDYFFVSEQLKERITGAGILREYVALDHCPIVLELDI